MLNLVGFLSLLNLVQLCVHTRVLNLVDFSIMAAARPVLGF
jgi:hypothetical protein